MKSFLKRYSYQLFKGGVLIKAGIGVVEIIVGIVFIVLNQGAIGSLAHFLIPASLAGGSIEAIIQSGLHDIFLYSNAFWAFIFLSHGFTKIILTYGLLRDMIWAYIASLIVFSYFIINQIYNDIFHHSVALELITLFDIIVVFLIFYEYRKQRNGRIAKEEKA